MDLGLRKKKWKVHYKLGHFINTFHGFINKFSLTSAGKIGCLGVYKFLLFFNGKHLPGKNLLYILVAAS
jgi:hypothetical protein